MKTWVVRRLLSIAVLVLGLSGGARAEDDYFSNEFRIVGRTPETSTFDCIGKPISPLCAVDTLVAGVDWKRPDLLATVGWVLKDKKGKVSNFDRLTLSLIQPLAQRRLNARNIPKERTEQGEKSWQPGDVALAVQLHRCFPNVQCVKDANENPDRDFTAECPISRCGPSVAYGIGMLKTTMVFILRDFGGQWAIVDHGKYMFELPDYFWDRN